ncbi:triple tyrosine motif-containing protein [Pontibacter saemangeumensis]|uniref:Triple tyrosine motif-containing protein n=1 Tax=Pontibacter saemangeumensis TaxID=1084525 RepID=A0ABP8LV59_9BACT
MTAASLSAQQYFFGNPFIRNFSTDEFAGGIQSWGIVQDNREVLYVANNFGMLEFDGSLWTNYPMQRGTKVRSVHTSSNGRIYIGSQADFGYFEPDGVGKLEYHSLLDSIPEEYRRFDEVWRIYEIGGKVYFCTFKYLYAFQPGKPLQVIVPGNPLEFSFKVNEQLYALEWNVGLSVLEGNRLRLLPGGEFFANRQIASVLPYGGKQLIVFTINDGIYLYDGNKATALPMANQAALQETIINQAVMLKDGTFALGTQNDGLYLMNKNGEVLLHLTRRDGIHDNTVHALYQDVHGNLWLALNNGLSMVELSSPFSRIDATTGVSGSGYAAYQQDEKLYIGTNSGLYRSDRAGAYRGFSLVPNSNGQVYQLRGFGDLLLMGHHKGPYIVDNAMASLLYAGKGAWDFVPVPGKPGFYIVGSYDGISLVEAVNGRLRLVRKYGGFEESSRVLSFDGSGTLWMAHGYKGIFKISFDDSYGRITKTRFYNSKDGLPSDLLVNMELIRNQLVFPAMYGIYRYDPQRDRFVKDEEFSSYFREGEHLVEMEEDLLGNIYFISNQRVGRLSFDKFGKPSIEDRLFQTIRDRLNDDLSYIRVLDLNNVLFGAKDGFVHYNAGKQKVMHPFNTQLTQVISTSQEVDSLLFSERVVSEEATYELPYELNSLRFAYASSFFESPEKTQYQYLLENFDKSWSEWTGKTEKEYTNLSEGDYVFRVRSRNVYGTTSESKSFAFKVHPPFYRSRIAFFAYIVAGFFLLGTFFHQVDKRFKREKNRLMRDQERRLSEKESEVLEVTKLNEQEILRLRHEKQQSEIDHMNRELTSSTFHLINKNELLNTVKQDLQGIIRKSERPSHGDELKRIIRNIEQNITSDADWNQFELHFNHVHGDFTNRLQGKYPNLTPQEIKLSTYLRLNLTTKEIAQLLNISVRGVEIGRYRLRKRLELDRSENLTDFMLKF